VTDVKKKPTKKMLGPTLQEFELVPVTDPVVFAEMDRRCRAVKKAMAAAEKAVSGRSGGRRKP
jgi:hypothetical protein